MRKPSFLILIIILHFSLISCGKNDETIETAEIIQPILTDISIASSESLISWNDYNDLLQKIENALSYNYGNANVTETETENNKVLMLTHHR